jgi:hypothetical protein
VTFTTFLVSLLPPLLAGLLVWTGVGKLVSRELRAQAARTALPRLVRGPDRSALVLRATGAVEVVLAAGLLVAPGSAAVGAGVALLGAGFLGYLGYARAVAPESDCGCSARTETPVTWHSFVRAGAVAAGGVLAATAAGPWWRALGDRPALAVLLWAIGAGGLAFLSAGPERTWQPRLRRLRLRLTGNPMRGGDGEVPVAASVELLERSLAFQSASGLIRSGLLEHWDEDGWRILHYTGAHHQDGRDRPLSVVFAVAADATLDDARGHVVRVSVVDQETEEVRTTELLGERLTGPGSGAGRTPLPMAG